MRYRTTLLPAAGLAWALLFAAGGQSQDGSDRPRPQPLDKVAFFRDRLQTCQLVVAIDEKRLCTFEREPLFKFENPVSQILDGLMFAWADNGRPVAVVKSYYNVRTKSWGRTFVSLATQPLEMRDGDRKLWTPQAPAVAFVRLEGAPAPANEQRRRLSQMRDLARRFEVVDHWGLKDPTDWQLRLLTTPLYRYEVPEEGVVDGALFGYSLTTSPEAVLLLEARKTPEGLAWHYAVSRCTRFEIRFSLDGKQLATFPRLEAWPPTEVYFHDPIVMADYPFSIEREAAKPGE